MTHEKIETCSSPCHGLLLRYASNGLQQSNPFGIRKHPALQYGGGHRGKVLTFAIGAETTSLSTLYMNNSLCCTSKLVYENLVDFDNGEIVPGLAESLGI